MSGKMALLSQYFVIMCVFILAVHGEKRLLLSDPDVVNNRLLQMEKEIQKLTSKMADLTSKMEQSSSGECTNLQNI